MALPVAVVLCCSKAGLAVARGLGMRGVPVIGVWYGGSKLAARSRFVRQHVRSPHPDQDTSGFVDFLLDRAAAWQHGVLFPTDDGSLLAVSRHKERLAMHYHVVAGDWPVVRPLLEKLSTYELAERLDVPCPMVRRIRKVETAILFAREVGFPCLIKPSMGHRFFARHRAKMLVVRSERELRDRIRDLGDWADELMLSEYIPGDDTAGVNYNSFRDGAGPVFEFTAAKVRLKPQCIGFPTVVESRDVPEVLQSGRTMLRGTGLMGFSCAEFKRDSRDGVYKLMEVNARHNFSGMLALECGVNFPYLSYAQAVGLEVEIPFPEWRRGVYWIDEERDAEGLLASLLGGPGMVRAYARPYLRKHVFAAFSWKDPLPSLQQATETFGRRHVRQTLNHQASKST